MVIADVKAVFDSMGRAMEPFDAVFEGGGLRTVWREELAWLTLQVIKKVRGCMSDLRAIAEGVGEETGLLPVDELERVLGGLAQELMANMLLKLNNVLCLPFVARPYEAQGAALIARNAVIEGDSDTVDAFSRNVLGKKHPARWREAVEMALLGDWVALLGTGMATKPFVRELLRRHADVQHRHLQPVWEGRIRGERTALLAQPVDEKRTIADLLVEYRTPEQDLLAQEREIRVSTVLKQLSAEEQAVALAWAEYGDPWAEVANELSQAAQFADRVRRKLRRLGLRHAGRAAEAERTTRRMR